MDNFGPGVSRVLQSDFTQYLETIWQQGRPPTDADLNLMQQLGIDAVRSSVLRGLPSGFLGNETNLQAAYLTNPIWSNFFKFGPQRIGEQQGILWANVNGWLVPVTATRTGSPPGSPNDVDTTNVIALDPPPAASGDFRIDFIYLEVWKARVQPNPSVTNKPASSAIYKNGNVEGGTSFLPDDLLDPAIGSETNQRVQLQYRIRVVKGLVGLTNNPDGFDPVVVKAQGAATAPTAYTFTNMRQVLGDSGLWRAGDGTQNALGTVDGYVYAVPMAAVFRRNGVIWNGNPSQNLNGAFNRNPTAVDRTGIKTFSTVPTLSANVTSSALTMTLVSVTTLPLPATPATPVLIQIGDELMTYSSITGSTLNIVSGSRGSNGTVADAHKAGATIKVMSTRPDGLFADQIALSDVLDLRHCVNPNGFDYQALLKGNLDKLLRGQLRSTWKLSGGGPRGSFVHYQDAITSAAVSLGVTKLDAPDNIRTVYSDAATVQPVECIVQPHGTIVAPGPGTPINVSGFSLGLTVNTTNQTVANQFTAGDIIVIPVNQLKNGLQAGSSDQVRWLNDSVVGAIRLRFDGENGDLPSSMYTVTPAIPLPGDDLTITFVGPNFSSQTNTSPTPKLLHIRAHIVYGAGRGLSRRPDSLHSVSFLSPSTDLMTQQSGVPANNKGTRVAWAPLWSKYRTGVLNGALPVTAEIYADLGSKTVVVTPFRRVDFPTPLTIDGLTSNPNPTVKAGSVVVAGTATSTNGPGITVGPTGTTAQYDSVVIASGPGTGTYTITGITPNTSITVDRPILVPSGTALSFTIHAAQGCMPLLTPAGSPKWAQTDPLGLFCGTSASSTGPANLSYESVYVIIPRHLVPGWGEIRTPILPVAALSFTSGVNYMIRSSSGSVAQSNYVAYTNGGGGSDEYSVFSQVTSTLTPLTYNTAVTGTESNKWAGTRFFTDGRGLNRKGLEFPPFYGVSRIMGVYQASDYAVAGSPFTDTRASGGTGTAVNLLRQSMASSDGPTMWVELDQDGDSTFILNANAVDISKAPTSISSFELGTYVVEAVVFGFDRGSFDLSREFKLVLTRPGTTNGWSSVGGGVSNVNNAGTQIGRNSNINKFVTAIPGLLPGPAQQSDQILVNYSRTVYQGDAWGSQSSYNDIAYSQGPIQSARAFQLTNTPLNPEALTRPNQKLLEVLASTSFSTDLGTGRYSAEGVLNALDFRDVGYEDPTAFPPVSGVADRPLVLPGNFNTNDVTSIGTEYLGCSERLPLGGLFRDKDFRGQSFGPTPAPLIYSDVVGNGPATGLAAGHQLEQDEVTLDSASSGVGSPGDLLVHVDGEAGDFTLLTNYRVYRGGSVFTANGSHPGGTVSLQNPAAVAQTTHCNLIQGRAMLVRNFVTNVGASEVSAGDELMLLVLTTVQRPAVASVQSPGFVTIGTNGAGEGYSAADLYRIEGHPLMRNNVRQQVDPATIQLSRRG